MSVASAEFLVAVLLLSAVYFRLPTGTARRVVLAVCNSGFLALFLPNLASVFALAAFLLSGYLAAILLRQHWSAAVLTGYLVLLVGAFIVLKKYEFLPARWLEHPIAIVGLSYMLFKKGLATGQGLESGAFLKSSTSGEFVRTSSVCR